MELGKMNLYWLWGQMPLAEEIVAMCSCPARLVSLLGPSQEQGDCLL